MAPIPKTNKDDNYVRRGVLKTSGANTNTLERSSLD